MVLKPELAWYRRLARTPVLLLLLLLLLCCTPVCSLPLQLEAAS